jgi:hypothetical protein
MCKYFIDTEFIEGSQKLTFSKQTKPTIDLISIGIAAEDGRTFYAVSKDFNLKDAWSRYEVVETQNNDGTKNYPRKVYWIRDNVLKPIFDELVHKWALEEDSANANPIIFTTGYNPPFKFDYKTFKKLIQRYGKRNSEIATQIKMFVKQDGVGELKAPPEFYGYYSDYDWVVFCWLFGKMIDLPKGFPMYCRDVKQMYDEAIEKLTNSDSFLHFHIEKPLTFKEKSDIVKAREDYPKNKGEHNALADAIWTKQLYYFVQVKIK